MKRRILLILLCLLTLAFSSCKQQTRGSALTSKGVSSALIAEISEPDAYMEYTSEDISYFSFASGKDLDISVLYSLDSTDVGEIGVVQVESDKAKEMLSEIEDHLKAQREEKSAFLKSYAPDELSKLENAKAKRFGEYIVYTILSPEDTEAVFKKAEELLK